MKNNLLANKIFSIRHHLSLTQSEFGKILGSSYQSVSAWEKGRNIPDIETITKIVNMAGITFNDFFNDNLVIPEIDNSQMYVTVEERSFINKLRSMDPKNRQAFLRILTNF